MTQNRDWREAKIPQWVRDSIAAEMLATEKRAALAWPTEARPTPVGFRWGPYDRLEGEIEFGLFWGAGHGGGEPFRVEIADNSGPEPLVKGGAYRRRSFCFRYLDGWTTTIPHRGPLFATRREAALEGLWLQCERAAVKLLKARGYLAGEP